MGKILWLMVRAQWDRALAIGAALVALLALLLGWIGVASTAYPAEQMPYVVSAGILGIMLAALAATLWVSADMRDEWRKLDEISRKLDASARIHPVSTYPVPGTETTSQVATPNGASPKRRDDARARSAPRS